MRTQYPRFPSVEAALALVCGLVIFRQSWPPDISVLAATGALVLLVAFSAMPLKWRPWLAIFILAGYVGMYRAEGVFQDKGHIGRFAPAKKAVITGTVKTPIEYFQRGSRFVLNAETLNGEPVSGLLRVGAYFEGMPPLPGETVELSNAYLKPVIGLKNFGGFDLERYLKDQGIVAQVNVRRSGELRVLRKAAPWRLDTACEKLRRNIAGFVGKHYPPEDAGAVAAMTVGVTGGITKEERRHYSGAGLAHLLAVAGLHVGFIGVAAYFSMYAAFFYFLYAVRPEWVEWGGHRKLAALFCILVVFIYVLTAGAHIPARRAGVMAAVYFFALLLGKEGDVLNSLAISAIIVLLLDPPALFSVSFVLSYTAVFAIAMLSLREREETGEGQAEEPETGLDRLEKNKRPARFRIITRFFARTMSVSAALGIATMPVLMFVFNEVSAGGFAANVVAVPLALFAIPSVFVAAALGGVWEPLGDAAAWLSSVAFSAIRFTAEFFGSGRFSFAGPAPSWWLAAFFYAVCLMWVFRFRLFKASAAGLCVAIVFFYWPRERAYSEVRFVDVGQGDSTLILLKDGTNILVDGGVRFGSYDAGEAEVLPELRRLGVRRLDAVIATHGDMDHVGGLYAVMRGIPVRRYMDNGEPHRALDGLRKMAGALHIPVFALHGGMEIPVSSAARLKVLHPSAQFVREHPGIKNNNVSVMLLLEAEGKRILLPADDEKEAERYLLENGADVRADVLKVAHHGSGSSTTPPFLRAVSPRLAVISVGKLNRYRMPAKKTLTTLGAMPIAVYQTKDAGEVSLALRDGKMIVRTYINGDSEDIY